MYRAVIRDVKDFQIGVVLTLFAREIFLSAKPNFRLFGAALRIRCGTKELDNHPKINHSSMLGDLKIRCGAKDFRLQN